MLCLLIDEENTRVSGHDGNLKSKKPFKQGCLLWPRNTRLNPFSSPNVELNFVPPILHLSLREGFSTVFLAVASECALVSLTRCYINWSHKLWTCIHEYLRQFRYSYWWRAHHVELFKQLIMTSWSSVYNPVVFGYYTLVLVQAFWAMRAPSVSWPRCVWKGNVKVSHQDYSHTNGSGNCRHSHNNATHGRTELKHVRNE